MRITIIGPTHPYKGGISHYNTLLFQSLLNSKKHDVNLISFKRQYPTFLYPAEQIDKKSTYKLKANAQFIIDYYNPLTWLKAVQNIRTRNSELVIFNWVSPLIAPVFSTICFFIRKFTKAKIFIICHNVLPHDSFFLNKLLTMLVLRQADYFILHSKESIKQLKSIIPKPHFKVSPHPTYQVFNKNKFTQKEKNSKAILFFGYVRPYKGLHYLLKAMPKILKKVNLKLFIVGEFWEKKEPYLKEIKELALTDHVQIVGEYVPNEKIEQFFSQADLVVLPYTSGTNSGIIQLAFGFNVPVICTDVGGFSEVVRDNKNGFVVRKKDSEALANAIIKYFREDKKTEFIKNIKEEKDRFSWDKMVKSIEELAYGG